MKHFTVLSVDDVAAMLAAETETIVDLAKSGDLPGTKFGKSWIFLAEDVHRFLKVRISNETFARRRSKEEATLPPYVRVLPARKGRRPPITLEEIDALARAHGIHFDNEK